MTSAGRLAGKVAAVTGAGSGLGAATARRFAAEGAAVVCADLSGQDDVSAAIVARGGQAIAVRTDVTNEDDTSGMAAAAVERFGHLDTLLANAGIPGSGSALDVDRDTWQRVLDVNLTGVWLSIRAALPPMLDRGGGSILTMASIGGLVGVPLLAPYAAAKGGVIALTRQVAAEYGPRGVRANALAPGMTPTPMTDASAAERAAISGAEVRSREERASRAAADLPLRRVGTTEDIAALAVFLASDESSWITGQVHVVDGGRTAV